MNSWDDEAFRRAIEATGKKALRHRRALDGSLSGDAGHRNDRSGLRSLHRDRRFGRHSSEAHERSVSRLIQAGAVPMVWLQVLLELQRDWARTDTYEAVTNLVKEHAGAYGTGVFYAKSMLGEHANESGQAAAGSAQ
jgi:nicotinamidase-related amidase